jgi:septum formation protein
MRIILGSSSARRKQILQETGLAFEVMVADIDEKAIRHKDPKELVRAIAKAKAAALLPRITEPSLLITTDGVVVCQGTIREKPSTSEEARRFLADYRECAATALTAVVVTNTHTGIQVSGVDVSTVFFRPFSAQAMQDMIEKGDAMKCAGGFNIADPFTEPYVERIEGPRDSVMGLPLELTKRLLQQAESSSPPVSSTRQRLV